MSRQTPLPEPPRPLPGLTACRLCAGETLGARDTVDGGQLSRLRALADAGLVRLTLADCLDECERGDVVVARRGAVRRPTGTRPVWFERLAGEEPTRELVEWLSGGGPGVTEVPPALRHLQIRRDPRGAGEH